MMSSPSLPRQFFLPPSSVSGLVLTDVPEIDQGIQSLIYNKDHVTAVTTIATVRAATGNIFFAAKGHMTISAFTASYVNFSSVSKHFVLLSDIKLFTD